LAASDIRYKSASSCSRNTHSISGAGQKDNWPAIGSVYFRFPERTPERWVCFCKVQVVKIHGLDPARYACDDMLQKFIL